MGKEGGGEGRKEGRKEPAWHIFTDFARILLFVKEFRPKVLDKPKEKGSQKLLPSARHATGLRKNLLIMSSPEGEFSKCFIIIIIKIHIPIWKWLVKFHNGEIQPKNVPHPLPAPARVDSHLSCPV